MSPSAAVAEGLPDDVLGDIFRRLSARSLAASRRVCKARLMSVVDEQQLLIPLRRLLPNSVHGLVINYVSNLRGRPHLLCQAHGSSNDRPSDRRPVPLHQ